MSLKDVLPSDFERENPNRMSALFDFESKLPYPEKPARVEVKEDLSLLGKKFDKDKPDWSLLPFKCLEGIVKVLTFGAKKYSRDNWKKVPDAKNRYTSALLRHFVDWQAGEKVDPESGLSHLYHMGCCLLFLIWFEENEVGSTN